MTADAKTGAGPAHLDSAAAHAIEHRLAGAGLRPTRQRVALLSLLTGQQDRHVSPEMLHAEALGKGIKVSLATVYNTLNQFTESGLLRKVTVDLGQSYFDTNLGPHHHFFDENSQQLIDICDSDVRCTRLPEPPRGKKIQQVDIVIRISD